jgi:hypothetical protein
MKCLEKFLNSGAKMIFVPANIFCYMFEFVKHSYYEFKKIPHKHYGNCSGVRQNIYCDKIS